MPKKPPAEEPDDDAPKPKKGKGDPRKDDPIDITNWRQRSQARAHQRNRVTYVTPALAEIFLADRVAQGLSQPDVARQLELPDGTPHPLIWRALERENDPSANPRATRDMLAKVTNRLEAYVKEMTVGELVAWSRAVNKDPAGQLQRAGLSQRSTATLEVAIATDERLSREARQAMLLMLEQMFRN